jgi:hypothetical protein
MQKLFFGILGLLVLYLAAANVRLRREGRFLEERLAAAGGKLSWTPPSGAPEGSPSGSTSETRAALAFPPPAKPQPERPRKAAPATPAADRENVAKIPGSGPNSEPLQLAGKNLTFTLKDDQATLVRVGGDEELGLTPAQQRAVEELRKNQETQTQVYTDQIQRIEAETEQAIRQLLSPEQLAKYDAQHPATVGATTFEPVEEPRTATGQRQGYLGISGGDAEGGGVQVTGVNPNTAASVFGLQQNDVILEFNGQPVSNLSALSGKIKESGEGFPVILKIRRGGAEFYQNVQLGALSK